VPLLVVRHARAGKRKEWQGDDRLRPLDERGRRQADGLPALLERYAVDRIVSSGYVRCIETVEPIAQHRALAIELRSELEEGASRESSLALLEDLGDGTVLCTHGDVLENLFGSDGRKGATRVVELRNGAPVVLELLDPPA
jgi:phosphohistidine phosphatase SixA